MVKNPSVNAEDIRDLGSIPRSEKIPWRRAWQRTPAFLPGESHGQRSLAGYIPYGCKSQTRLKPLSTHAHTVDVVFVYKPEENIVHIHFIFAILAFILQPEGSIYHDFCAFRPSYD